MCTLKNCGSRYRLLYFSGAYGFLSVEIEDGKKLIFYMSDVRGSPNSLQPGDTVEYTLVTSQRSGKSTACNVTKIR